MSHTWDPAQYLRHADDRARPFVELLHRVDPAGETGVGTVVDLGCGPGHLTRLLARRWPGARVTGVDSSAAMVEAARGAGDGGIAWVHADLRTWAPPDPVDVLVSNATLQWVPGHLDLLPRLLEQVRPGGWFAMQVPANESAPTTTLRRELAADPRFAPHLAGVAEVAAHEPAAYLERLAGLAPHVDVWETTYSHVLAGDDPVLDWVLGTGARPTVQALPEPLRTEFTAAYAAGLRAAYPRREHGTVLPFRRVFAVARR